ncbi:cGMP-dependent protein kinase 1-like [Cylas formicarius]|uniref:cGMP-dependent protein kinase 1-like n=1 Tax=Cylas formicarius TaxID=197179 RepID=UPI0029589016|nr:cGMP-dependent protein kinase 1-like [Cylas formicarius]
MLCMCQKSKKYTINTDRTNSEISLNRRETIKPITNGVDAESQPTSTQQVGHKNAPRDERNSSNRYKDTSKTVQIELEARKDSLKNTASKPADAPRTINGDVEERSDSKISLTEDASFESLNISRDTLIGPSSSLQIENASDESNRSSFVEDKGVSRRRSGVPASIPLGIEDTSKTMLPVYPKSSEDEQKIKSAIEKNDFLGKILSGKRLEDVINAMSLREVSAKQKLIKQGEKGSEMYVSKEGKYRVMVKGKAVGDFDDIRVFGELAILYNAKRLASIQALTDGKVWVLDRRVYQKIVISSNIKEEEENLRFLQNVDSLKVVDVDILRQVANLLKPEFFPSGTQIIRQGDKGNKFYIIRAGTVTISKSGEGIIGTLGEGTCFGELALQKEDTRQATVTADAPGVDCMTLTRTDFKDHFGDVEIPKIEIKRGSFREEAKAEYQDIGLSDLKILKTLGVGGFGRVELVQHKKKKDLVFALKYLKKIEVVYQNQQEHVYNEKMIQMNCKSNFIVRLYRTYKDNKYVYFLMESCLGGDLFSLLHKQKNKRFEEKDAKFLSACVLEAFEYLHNKAIVYRDLKPENLLVDRHGYLKLTDFGFAKKMPARGKTFTFAGTPEYVAPEIVLNRGHDKAVDYWAFGAFIFELLSGRTPFRTGDNSHMRTYNKILNGIDNVNFPTYINLKARNLIEKLCRPVPSERLGMLRGGTKDIKMHKWYQGFEWVRFSQCQLQSPFKPKLKDVTDTSHFDQFRQDKDYPPDETSGWDVNF